MASDSKIKKLYECFVYPILNNILPKKQNKSLIYTIAIRIFELTRFSTYSAKRVYRYPQIEKTKYTLRDLSKSWKNKEEWKQIIKLKNDNEILNIIFANPNVMDHYHKISPTAVKENFTSIQSIVQGVRPLASTCGAMLLPAGLEEELKKARIGILKCTKTTVVDLEDGLEQKDFRKRNYEFQLGDYRTLILYRPGHLEDAKELAKTLISTQSQDPYRFQRIGRLLFYKEEEIKNFCSVNKYSYTENDLPPSLTRIEDSEYEIVT